MKKLFPMGAAFAVLAVFLSGCATTPRQPPIVLTGNIMVDAPNAIANGPPRDRVLWQYRKAAATMRLGQFDKAKELLDDALLSIGGIITDDRSARRARSLFREEAKKGFIGEPYERVMAYYYRGILYWMDGEADNARACFRSAQIMDADTENNEYAADYVLLDYLDGLASTKLLGDGSDAFQRAMGVARLAKPPPYSLQANVLVFAEFGPGPTKFATGEYREQLRFRCPNSPVSAAQVIVRGQTHRLDAYDDLCFQATTRGGRVMDHILANKAVFKATTDTFGDAAIVSGAILAGTQQGRGTVADEVGFGLLAAGLVSKLVSAATTPAADVRTWDNLPRYLSFAALELPPGQHEATVEFLDQTGRVKPALTKTITIHVNSTSPDKVVFVSDKSTTPKSL